MLSDLKVFFKIFLLYFRSSISENIYRFGSNFRHTHFKIYRKYILDRMFSRYIFLNTQSRRKKNAEIFIIRLVRIDFGIAGFMECRGKNKRGVQEEMQFFFIPNLVVLRLQPWPIRDIRFNRKTHVIMKEKKNKII